MRVIMKMLVGSVELLRLMMRMTTKIKMGTTPVSSQVAAKERVEAGVGVGLVVAVVVVAEVVVAAKAGVVVAVGANLAALPKVGAEVEVPVAAEAEASQAAVPHHALGHVVQVKVEVEAEVLVRVEVEAEVPVVAKRAVEVRQRNRLTRARKMRKKSLDQPVAQKIVIKFLVLYQVIMKECKGKGSENCCEIYHVFIAIY